MKQLVLLAFCSIHLSVFADDAVTTGNRLEIGIGNALQDKV
ncbi:MAG: hypothetical protein ABFS56_04215 [Pseudomonadota bacterium]